jgi:hypothetical protein
MCKHTDRVLFEVRKPGRPLENCPHDLATCVCGKVDNVKADERRKSLAPGM